MKNTYFAYFAAIIPSLIILWYFYKMDRAKPEPKRMIMGVFIMGILSTLPLIYLDLYLTHIQLYLKWPKIPYELFVAFIQAGFCEELIKLLIVLLFIYRHNKFDEVSDGIIYMITASLGFACLENILYVVGKPFSLAVARALTAVPFHAVCSGIMGYYVGRARFTKYKRLEWRLILTGFFISVTIHGFYNFTLFLSPWLGSLYSSVLVPIIYIVYKRLKSKINLAIDHDIIHNRV